MQKLINHSLSKNIILIIILFVNISANDKLTPVSDTINIKNKELIIYNSDDSIKTNSMPIRVIGVIASIPIGAINGLGLLGHVQLNDNLIILSHTLIHMGITYFIVKYAPSENFIFNGYIGPNYSITKDTENGFNLGGNVSIYTGVKFLNHFSTGFEFDIIKRKQINKDNTKTLYKYVGDGLSEITTYKETSTTKEFIAYIPLSFKYHFNFNNKNKLTFGIGAGYPIIFGFNRTYNDSLINTTYSHNYYESISSESDIADARELRTMIKFGIEYQKNKNIIRSSAYIDNYKYLNNVNTFSIEYGRAFN